MADWVNACRALDVAAFSSASFDIWLGQELEVGRYKPSMQLTLSSHSGLPDAHSAASNVAASTGAIIASLLWLSIAEVRASATPTGESPHAALTTAMSPAATTAHTPLLTAFMALW